MDPLQAIEEALRVAVGPDAAIVALAAIGLNVHFGYAGLLNFGQVAFLLVGAYSVAITVDAGGPMWLGLVLGVIGAAVLALLIGIPTLRLRADYLAIVTIAVGEILRIVVNSSWARSVTGGSQGISNVRVDGEQINVANAFYRLNPIPDGTYGFGAFRFSHRSLWVMAVGWGLAVLFTVVVRYLAVSPWGRVLKSIREDEDAARSLGKNVFAYKMQALVIGGVIGAFAGYILLFRQTSAQPRSFIPVETFFAYTVLILGGVGTTVGPLIGAVIFWFFIEFARALMAQGRDSGALDFLSSQDISSIRFVLVGVLLMALMVGRPQGIFGKREELLLDA